jgi:hypothetical protein
MTDETPIGPLVDASKRATIHFAKAAYEVFTGVGALVAGVVNTVRPPDEDDTGGPQRVPVE